MSCQICGRGNIAVVLCGSCVPSPIPPRKDKKKSIRRGRHKAKGDYCFYCGSKEDLTTDHKTPLSRFGDNKSSNLLRACRGCNEDKADMTYEEYKESLGGIEFFGELENA